MSADFWAGYLSGAAGILIGNPLDLVKTRLQAGPPDADPATTVSPKAFRNHFDRAGTLVKGATAPLLGYGALNAILFVTYNRSLTLLGDSPLAPSSLLKVWSAGAAGGLATFIVSAPTELIKCRAQVFRGRDTSSWAIARDTWRSEGLKGLYHGGVVTSVRDAVGYGFYFWSYEWSKQAISAPEDTQSRAALKVLLCGGLAGIVTWASIFPLDVIKTRVQTQVVDYMGSGESSQERQRLLQNGPATTAAKEHRRLGALEVARQTYRNEGFSAFFRGLGVCSVRAFVVNAVQWAVYEWMMRLLSKA